LLPWKWKEVSFHYFGDGCACSERRFERRDGGGAERARSVAGQTTGMEGDVLAQAARERKLIT
jgi:hypothetical protein